MKKINIGFVIRVMLVLSFLFLTRLVTADVVMSKEPYAAYDSPTAEFVNTTYDFDVSIGPDNYETSVYKITSYNPTNASLTLTLNGYFNYLPKSMSLKVNGVEEEFTIATQMDKDRNVQYQNKYTLPPNATMLFDVSYNSLLVPNQNNLGLWSIPYYYNNPVSLTYEYPEVDRRTTYIDYYSRVRYNGELKLGYPGSNVQCSGCTFDRAKNTAKIDNTQWFSINWEKKRTPFTSTIVYLLMVGVIFALIIRARKLLK
jgi:hypothetical protein